MSRRPVNPSRRLQDNAGVPFSTSVHQKSRTSPLLSLALVLGGVFLLGWYLHSGPGGFSTNREAIKDEGASCTSDVLQSIPLLQKVYGNSMQKVLHVGPDTCSVISKLLKEDDTEAWGVEPYDLEDTDVTCKSLVRKGFARVADIKFPLPYRPRSFSLVIVSDALDYLSPRYLNKTLPNLASLAADGIVVFAGFPGQQRLKVPDLSKFGKPAKLRSSSWWIRYFVQVGLEENEVALKKFEQAASKKVFKPSCQIFHLNPKSFR
ncbi:putative pectin methylesterase CGR2 [Wolffia australiana]